MHDRVNFLLLLSLVVAQSLTAIYQTMGMPFPVGLGNHDCSNSLEQDFK
jgi:hypothetical protein